MKNKLLSLLPFFFIIVVATFTILPLFHSGFFPVHDDTQVQRVYEMYVSLRDGMFPVRWVEDLGYGYGYPLFNFYGPLAYYIGALFVFLFSNSLIATKVMIGCAMVGSSVTMYLLGKSLWGKWGGMTSAALYLVAPYHAVDVYVRGDIGELWAYMFFPLALLGVWKIYKKPSFFSMSIGAIGLAGVVLSHNLSAFLFTPFLLATLVISSIASKKSVRKEVVAANGGLFLFGVLLSLFYSLPVLTEMSYTNVLSQVGGGADFHNHFVCLNQLWQSQWGFGGSAPGCLDGFSFMIGKVHVVLSIFAALLLPFIWKKKSIFTLGLFGLIGLIVSVFLMLPVSSWVWNSVHQMAFLQYPWRYLLLASLFSSLLGGMVVSVVFEKQKMFGIGLSLLILLGVVVLNLKYFQPQLYLSVTDSYLTSPYSLQLVASKISDEYMPVSFIKPKSFNEIPQTFLVQNTTMSQIKEVSKTQEKTVLITLAGPLSVSFNLAYFPGWSAFDNGKAVSLSQTPKGIVINLPAGSHALTFLYTGTVIENVSNIISLTSAIILILAIIWKHTKLYERKSS